MRKKYPLVVDLDGTLVRSDTLIESLLRLIKKSPFALFLLPILLLQSRQKFKWHLAKRVECSPESLPYDEELVGFLKAEQSQRPLILMSASNEKTVQAVADHLGIFDQFYGSSRSVNLKGTKKVELLKEKFGKYAYVGNSYADVPVWADADEALIVYRSKKLLKKLVSSHSNVTKTFDRRVTNVGVFFKAIRLQQWVKNLLIFLPLFLAHQFHFDLMVDTLLAFLALSLCASSVYLLNDLLDLSADRKHRTKKRRPLASGALPLGAGIALFPVFLISSALIALEIKSLEFVYTLGGYFVLTLLYSFKIKGVMLLDGLMLAILYTIRLFAGSMATGIPISDWFFIFSIFFFYSLAMVKRVTELMYLKEAGGVTRTRGYTTQDVHQLTMQGLICGYLSILVFALYIFDENTGNLYGNTKFLWGVCLVLMYWVGRVWMLVARNEMDDDPINFAIKDRTSLVCISVIALMMLLATGKFGI